MTEITLTRSETTLLLAAAQAQGRLSLPDSMKPVTAERLLGKLRKHSLIDADDPEPRLTGAGYTLVGLRPPRKARPTSETSSDQDAPLKPRKGALLVALVVRADGASLPELVEATGWLPHTTRAAICRLRKDGRAIIRSARPDGTNAYRCAAPEALARPSRRRARKVEAH